MNPLHARTTPRLALLAALVLLALAGCQERDPTLLRFGLGAAPRNLDPRFATDAASSRVVRLIYERLVDFDERFRPVPGIARWRREGARRWRFELTGEHRFSDGTPLTAADVKATYESVLDPATGSPHRGSLATIERIELLGPRALRFVLARPDPLFPGRLAVGIVPAAALAAGRNLAREPLGSGPFELLSWDGEQRLRLRRRRDRQRFELVRVPNPTVRLLKLVRGEVDMLQGDLPPELVAWAEERGSVRVLRRPGTTFAYLGFNLEDPVSGRLAVRQAVAHAIDRQAIIRYILGGAARPAATILPPEHWAGAPRLRPPAFDPARARAILAAAGLVGKHRPRLVYKTSADPFRVRLATVIQAQLERAGIEVEVRSYDWGTFYGDVKAGRFQMYSLAWIGVKLPDIFRYTMHSEAVPPAGANRGRYRSARADALIEAAEQAADPAEQARLYRELQALLLADLPYVPLWYEDQVFVSRARVRGFRVAPDGGWEGLAGVAAIGAEGRR